MKPAAYRTRIYFHEDGDMVWKYTQQPEHVGSVPLFIIEEIVRTIQDEARFFNKDGKMAATRLIQVLERKSMEASLMME